MIIFARMIDGYILNKQDRMVLETIRRTIRSGTVSITITIIISIIPLKDALSYIANTIRRNTSLKNGIYKLQRFSV